MAKNLLLSTDSYKQSHFLQYPPGLEYVTSYIEARPAQGRTDQVTQFFGLQAFIEEYLLPPITSYDIHEAKILCKAHGVPFNEEGWRYILKTHNGYLPLSIQALPEGGVYQRGTPLVQINNTDPKCAWLVSFIETALLRAVWYPSSVATRSFMLKAVIYDTMLRSCDTLGGLPFKLHDFGARGVSSSGSAILGGMAHLVNFQGTDTMEGLLGAQRFYGFDGAAGFSLPASEHSTMTSWGKDREADAYENMIDQFGDGLFSIVSDSYDLWNAVDTIFGKELKRKILAMDGKLIVRPDSGDPVSVPIQVMERLWAAFGGTTNSKGFKVLNPKVGVIQGDGLDDETLAFLVTAVMNAGFSLDNIAFGMGGGLLQAHMRDDMRFAMKVNAVKFAGDTTWTDVAKNPKTDPSKRSKAGRQAVLYVEGNGDFATLREEQLPAWEENCLRPIWQNGDYPKGGFTEFNTVRQLASEELVNFHSRVFGGVVPFQNAAE